MAAQEVRKVVVTCPKCKVRLKVDETKLKPEGSRFKCPKCGSALLVKKPAAAAKKSLDRKKVMIAHSNPVIMEQILSLLKERNLTSITASDGINAMVKALKELPFLSLVEVALPKIYGFEVCKRLKTRTESKDMKCILVASIYDKTKYKREPSSLYGADDYIEEHMISEELAGKIDALLGSKEQPYPDKSQAGQEKLPPSAPTAARELPGREEQPSEEKIERARRLARTIINDIYLYNSGKVEDSIRNENFYQAFAAEVREGRKLYESRILQEVKDINDFYLEAIENFISAKKKNLS
jgi:predicted Zn finger-like uncharacterized protein